MSDNLLLSGHSVSPSVISTIPSHSFCSSPMLCTHSSVFQKAGNIFFNVHVFSSHSRNDIALGTQYDGLKEQWWFFLCCSRKPKQKPSEELHFPFLLYSNGLWMVKASAASTSPKVAEAVLEWSSSCFEGCKQDPRRFFDHSCLSY